MSRDDGQKSVILTLERGGLHGQPLTPEEELDRDIRAACAKMRGRNGKVPGRAFYRIAGGVQWPGRMIARYIRRAKQQRVPFEEVDATFVRPIARYARKVYRHDSGEFFPAA